MDLFSGGVKTNLLPYDGEVYYYGKILNSEDCRHFLECMLNDIEWKNDEAVIFGRHIITKRKAAWYGDKNYSYTYSNTTKTALPWTPELLQLRKMVEKNTRAKYNSCLLNLYPSGTEGMAWHSDDEKMLGKNSAIASLTFGAERKFAFKHKETKQKVELILGDGALLVMKGTTQTHWLHRLPPTKKVTRPRVNLTFRTMVD